MLTTVVLPVLLGNRQAGPVHKHLKVQVVHRGKGAIGVITKADPLHVFAQHGAEAPCVVMVLQG